MPTNECLNILLIIYQFPPIGDAQIIRWVNLIRFWAEQGHHISVVTGDFPPNEKTSDDRSRLEMIDHPNIAIHRVKMKAASMSRSQILVKWVKPAYELAQKLTQSQRFDVAVTSALPIWAHVVGSLLRARGHVKLWLADYGDPWSTSHTLGQSGLKKKLEMNIERLLLRPADGITVTTPEAINAFTPIFNKPDHIFVVPMGASYFHLQTDWTQPHRTEIDQLQVLFPGTFYRTREPDKLFEGLAQVEDVHLTIAGRHRIDVQDYVQRYGVKDKLTLLDYMPLKEVIEAQKKADVLLLTSWPVPEQLSGKFYEYLATNKPILYITDHEDDIATRLLREKGIGYICRNNPDAIASAFRSLREDARQQRLAVRQPETDVGFDVRAQSYIDIVNQFANSSNTSTKRPTVRVQRGKAQNKKMVFISWLRHDERSALVGKHLGADVYFIQWGRRKPYMAPLRYIVQSFLTWPILRREKPDIILVQVPPIFAGPVVQLYARLYGAKYILDTHSSSFFSTVGRLTTGYHKLLSKGALTTLVPNVTIEAILKRWNCPVIRLGYTPDTYPEGTPYPFSKDFNVVFISSFSPDEPLETVLEVAEKLPSVHFYITGDYKRKSANIINRQTANVTFTGYLEYDAFVGLLRGCDAIMDLTTRDATLLMGGYEAVSLEKPLITSDWPILKEYFSSGTVHVANTTEGIAAGIQQAQNNLEKLRGEMRDLKAKMLAEWDENFAKLVKVIEG
jgi:glycosyltransferase involved in cell wall biosynthesis